MNSNLDVHVLFRFSKKSGKIDTTMTGRGSALMQMWALNNTTSSKVTMIFNRETGNLVFQVIGKKDGFPKVQKSQANGDMGNCAAYGISLEDLQSITDDRFDGVVD